MNIGDLTVRLGVKADTYKVRDFSSAVGAIPVKAVAAIAAITAITSAIIKFTTNSLELSNNLEMFRSQTGLSTDELQRWSAVAQQVGVSGDAVDSSIMGIQNAIAQLSMGQGGGALQPFGRLGIKDLSPDRDAFDILKEIGQNKNKLSRAQMIATIGDLGVKADMMRIFDTGSRFNSMAANLPRMSAQDSRAMQDLQVELARFNVIVSKAFIPVLTEITPYMGDLAKAIGLLVQVLAKTTIKGLSFWKNILGEDPKYEEWIKSPSNKSFEEWKKETARSGDITVNQNIHSTADAREVARIAAEQFKKEKNNANKQFNNGGY